MCKEFFMTPGLEIMKTPHDSEREDGSPGPPHPLSVLRARPETLPEGFVQGHPELRGKPEELLEEYQKVVLTAWISYRDSMDSPPEEYIKAHPELSEEARLRQFKDEDLLRLSTDLAKQGAHVLRKIVDDYTKARNGFYMLPPGKLEAAASHMKRYPRTPPEFYPVWARGVSPGVRGAAPENSTESGSFPVLMDSSAGVEAISEEPEEPGIGRFESDLAHAEANPDAPVPDNMRGATDGGSKTPRRQLPLRNPNATLKERIARLYEEQQEQNKGRG
jgi:hypothetical protein